MAGPDPKRMYLAINSQNIESLKAERPYWSKPFVFVTPSGTGTKYTSLQAAMMLQKMKVVDFLIDQPSVDLTVKSTDGKSTLIIAVEAKMKVSVLEKILRKLELRCLAEVDPSGKGPVDYAVPGSDEYEFLHSMGCKTKQEKEAAIAGFFGEDVKGTVPGVSEHQRRRKKGGAREQKSTKEGNIAPSSRSASEEDNSDRASDAPHSNVEEVESTWRHFDDIDELETALKAYIHEWGDDHEEGKNCAHWLRSVSRARETGKTKKLLAKWNASMALKEKDDDGARDGGKDSTSRPSKGKSSKRSPSAGSSEGDPTQTQGHCKGSTMLDPEAVKLFFAGKAEDQVG
ncbi:hypothetical protein cyc_06421 [Cyclospora cayetanensis]|uniref:Ankyrin repeat-containing protein n=1 Tax=Cyclospora cayetanensis TaxID=88456 RepID=A0A1D3CXU4_9EIME|nr:hypothetical protein cyc_06421 [Cyclospora cayetanensis]